MGGVKGTGELWAARDWLMSKRKKKQTARSGAHDLRQRAGWDPRSPDRPGAADALRELGEKQRARSAYGAAQSCAACEARRRELADETALCETHLSEALGT